MKKQLFQFSRRSSPLQTSDAIAFILIAFLLSAAGGGLHLLPSLSPSEPPPMVTLQLSSLPACALASLSRLTTALFFALTVSVFLGLLAAKHRFLGRLLVPAFDVLNAIPILAYPVFTVPVFYSLSSNPHTIATGVVVSTVFFAQVWNMTRSVYQSVTTLPPDLADVASNLQLSSWLRFWHLELPALVPNLTWNMIVSLSNSWFFLIAIETLIVAGHPISLPGVGAYLSAAIHHKEIGPLLYTIAAMLILMGIYHVLLIQPVTYWSTHFSTSQQTEHKPSPPIVIRVLRLLRLTYLFKAFIHCFIQLGNYFPQSHAPGHLQTKHFSYPAPSSLIFLLFFFFTGLAFLYALACWLQCTYIPLSEFLHLLLLASYTLLRIISALLCSTLLAVPLGIWIGYKPHWVKYALPVAQFLAAFPTNLLFPFAVMLILSFHLTIQLWCIPLLILGTFWLLFFNVMIGIQSIPKSLRQASASLRVSGFLWWKRISLPAILPFYLTGMLSALSNAWNLSVISELIHWGPHALQATGIGSYLQLHIQQHQNSQTIIAMLLIALLSILTNQLLSRGFYYYSKYRLNTLTGYSS